MHRLLASALLALLLPAAPAASALVVLTEGRHLKAASFELQGEEKIRVVLVGGGEIVLPIERVERIVDDELEPFAAPEEPAAPAPKAWPSVRQPSGRPHSAPARWARLVEEAVRGMLPKSKLGDAMYRKLKVYEGADHPHAAQQPTAIEVA